MVVATGVGVEACFGLRAAYLDHQADPDKGFQDSIDCRSRQSMNIFFEIIKELVSRRVICALTQCMEQCPPLVGQAESPVTADSLHLLNFFVIDALIVFGHVWEYIPDGILCQLVSLHLILKHKRGCWFENGWVPSILLLWMGGSVITSKRLF